MADNLAHTEFSEHGQCLALLSDTLTGDQAKRCFQQLLTAPDLKRASIYFSYTYAPKIARKISPSTVHGILRVIAFILLCIGVQIAWNGLSPLLTDILHPA